MQNREGVSEVKEPNSSVIALDVGGTTIKSAVVGDDEALIGPVQTDQIDPSRPARELIDNFLGVIKRQLNRALNRGYEVLGVAIAFPGPFDYKRGISLIKGVGKYEALYGIDLGKELRKGLHYEKELPIVFEADSWAFAQGQYLKGAARGMERVIAISIGTGLGSAFLENGRILQSERGIPKYSWIGNMPFEDGILDDRVSRRGIIRRYKSLALPFDREKTKIDVLEIFSLAQSGDSVARQTFEETGYILGKALKKAFVKEFRPECIVIGGKISGAFDYLLPGLEKAILVEDANAPQPKIVKAIEIDSCTLIGVAIYSRLLKRRSCRRKSL